MVARAALALALAAPLSAQQALSESFDTTATGVFPPAGWTEQNAGNGYFWQDSATWIPYINYGFQMDAAAHDYTTGGVMAEATAK